MHGHIFSWRRIGPAAHDSVAPKTFRQRLHEMTRTLEAATAQHIKAARSAIGNHAGQGTPTEAANSLLFLLFFSDGSLARLPWQAWDRLRASGTDAAPRPASATLEFRTLDGQKSTLELPSLGLRYEAACKSHLMAVDERPDSRTSRPMLAHHGSCPRPADWPSRNHYE